MASFRRFEIDDILNRPGTYFNPETEVLIVVDDSVALDSDLFEEGPAEGGDWVLLGDEVPIDERSREEVVERFEVRYHPGTSGAVAAGEDDEDEPEEELEPDEEPEEL